MSGRLVYREVTIASSETKSDAFQAGQEIVVGIYLPATFTGSTIGFEAGSSESSLVAVHDSDGAVSLSVTQGTFLSIDPSLLAGCDMLKVVSGSTEAAERTLTVVLRSVE